MRTRRQSRTGLSTTIRNNPLLVMFALAGLPEHLFGRRHSVAVATVLLFLSSLSTVLVSPLLTLTSHCPKRSALALEDL